VSFPLLYRDIATFEEAAQNGSRLLLDWLHQNNCPMGVSVMRKAAAAGNLENLVRLRELGCPWDVSVSNAAKDAYQDEAFRWLVTNGCPEIGGYHLLNMKE